MLLSDQVNTVLTEDVDWKLRLVDAVGQEEFFQHNVVHRKKKSIGFVCFLIYFSCFVMPVNLVSFAYIQSMRGWIFATVLFFSTLVISTTGWMLMFPERLLQKYRKKIPLIQLVFIFALHIYIIFYVYRDLITNDCDSFPQGLRNFFTSWHCGSDFSLNFLPLLALIPIGLILLLGETRMELVLSASLIAIILVVTFSLLKSNIPFAVFTIVYGLISIYFGIKIHLYRIHEFIQQRKLSGLIENEEARKATELRNMIGNLAHDLKTPLSSFMAALDIIGNSIQSMEQTLDASSLNNHNASMYSQVTAETQYSLDVDTSFRINTLKHYLDIMKQCFKSSCTTHSFMLMTINRCIDHAKASKGIRLTPKYETVHLMDTISMPLQCMSNIQERIEIELKQPINTEICSHVITDKQWLQENLLCLLSNAVKYSSTGMVTISMSLIEKEKIGDEFSTSLRGSSPSPSPSSSPSPSPDKENMISVTQSVTDNSKSKTLVLGMNNKVAPSILVSPFGVRRNKTSPSQKNCYLRFEVEDHGIGKVLCFVFIMH